MLRLSIVFLLTLLWSLPAGAGTVSWKHCTSGDAQGTVAVRQSVCADPVTGSQDTVILHVGGCENFDVIYNADDTGTETTMKVKVMNCVNPTADTNNCNVIQNIELTGATDKEALYGAAGEWIYIQGDVDPVSTTPRVLVHCNP